MLNSLLPINLTAYWTTQSKAEPCNEKISSWLYDSDSLTQKLEATCERFHVQIRQQRKTSSLDPSLSGYFAKDSDILLREVFLYCDNTPVIFAQTEIPLSTFTQEELKLTEIGTQSLGKILFQDPNMRRGEIEVTQFSKKAQQQKFHSSLKLNCSHSLWARRSVFYINNKPLLISELFLPGSGIY